MRNSREKWGKPRVNRDALEIGGKWIWLLRWVRPLQCNSVVTSDYDDYEYCGCSIEISIGTFAEKKIKVIKNISTREFPPLEKNWNPNRIWRGNSDTRSKEKRDWLAQRFIRLPGMKDFLFIYYSCNNYRYIETMQTGHFLLR